MPRRIHREGVTRKLMGVEIPAPIVRWHVRGEGIHLARRSHQPHSKKVATIRDDIANAESYSSPMYLFSAKGAISCQPGATPQDSNLFLSER